MERLENVPFDELTVGDSRTFARVLTPEDVERLAEASGALDPFADRTGLTTTNYFQAVAMSAGWAEALTAAMIATRFPGPGTQLRRHNFDVTRGVAPGDTLTLAITVNAKSAEGRGVTLGCRATNQRGELAMSGIAEVIAPPDKYSRDVEGGPSAEPREKGRRYRRLMDMAKQLPPLRTAVVHPVDEASLVGAVEAQRAGLIRAILVGPEERIRRVAEIAGIDLADFEIVTTPHSHASAATAVALVHAGKAEALMKGALHTDEMMHEIVDPAKGLRTARRMSHVFAIDAPSYPRSLFITDAAVNIYPKLLDKRDIVQNAIDLAKALGVLVPRVAILSAVETVSPDIASTIDAAALCKMAERGQIVGGILDGPLAFDNAVSSEAARAKGIISAVAGRADILLAPDLEAGNMLAKQLVYLADADMAGIVLGARAPIILTSRADGTLSRLASCAIALLWARRPT